ncbi:MAG: bifunctional DNA-formamidopyrimidine glycosylase/DNA-(apurinic or apyrimidinic site) lyase [Sphingomonadales bacterium]
MPELPEVETVRCGLAPRLEGKTLVKAKAFRPDIRFPIPENLESALVGKEVSNVKRRAKYILIEVSNGPTIILHLGMSGRIFITTEKPFPPLLKHDHVMFETKEGSRITFNDPRRFGFLIFSDTGNIDDHKFFKDMGPEPLGNSFSGPILFKRLMGKKSTIKAALLDQRTVAGLGNIYVSEALNRAGVSPLRLAGSLKIREAEGLTKQIKQVLTEALEAGGSSLRDFKAVDGELGYFQHRFKVYGQEGKPCSNLKCKGKILKIVQSNRSSFYCPKCQK